MKKKKNEEGTGAKKKEKLDGGDQPCRNRRKLGSDPKRYEQRTAGWKIDFSIKMKFFLAFQC